MLLYFRNLTLFSDKKWYAASKHKMYLRGPIMLPVSKAIFFIFLSLLRFGADISTLYIQN